MKTIKNVFFISFAVFVLMTVSVSFQQQKPTITGTWNLTAETTVGAGSPVFVLLQENDSTFTGNYTGAFGEAPVKGTLKGNSFKLQFVVYDAVAEYTGTIDGDTMKGKIKLASYGEGTFTGERKKE